MEQVQAQLYEQMHKMLKNLQEVPFLMSTTKSSISGEQNAPIAGNSCLSLNHTLAVQRFLMCRIFGQTE